MSKRSINEFVGEIYAEGVEAGQLAGDEIVEKAQQQADQIIAEAQEKAASFTEKAREEAKVRTKHLNAELQLAARDVMLELQQGIRLVLEEILHSRVEQVFSDGEYLKRLVRDVAIQYAAKDARNVGVFTVDLPGDHASEIGKWVIGELTTEFNGRAAVSLCDGLAERGFSLGVDESTLEVTPDSIVELLRSKLSVSARELVENAVKTGLRIDE